jgi:hypothetical protein
MHWQLVVSLDRAHARSSMQARRFASQTLGSDPTFVAEGGLGVVCDWFVVGGRSSGALAWAKAHARRAGNDRVVPGVRVSALLPRDPYRALGHADDAMIVDQALYRSVLQGFAGQTVGEIDGTMVFRDLDGGSVTDAFIGTKWLVVLDCHR